MKFEDTKYVPKTLHQRKVRRGPNPGVEVYSWASWSHSAICESADNFLLKHLGPGWRPRDKPSIVLALCVLNREMIVYIEIFLLAVLFSDSLGFHIYF